MKRKIISILLSITVVLASFPMMVGAAAVPTNPLDPGPSTNSKDGVSVTESASLLNAANNEYQLNFKVEGSETKINNNADIVLLIDKSSDMHSSAGKIKTAAINFVKQVLSGKNTGNKIAIVPFGATVEPGTGLTDDEEAVDAVINNITFPTLFAGTYTQAALHKADTILQGSTAKNKIIVLLSNGKPTISATPMFGNLKCTHTVEKIPIIILGHVIGYNSIDHYTWNNDETITGFDYKNTDGTGIGLFPSCTQTFWPDGCLHVPFIHDYTVTKTYDEIALADVNFGKAKGYTYYSIGYDLNNPLDKLFDRISKAKDFLQDVATDKTKYFDATKDNLSSILSGLGNRIEQTATHSTVTIPLSNNIELVTETGKLSKGVAYDPAKNTLTWTIGDVKAGTPATLSIHVKLNIYAPDFDKDASYPTNSTTGTILSYSDPLKTLVFHVPTVKGTCATLFSRGYLVDSNGNPINENGETVTKENAVVVYGETTVINSKNGKNLWECCAQQVTAETKTGYTLSGSTTQTVTLSDSNLKGVAWFPYTIKKYTATIHYVDTNGASIHADAPVPNLAYGADYKATPLEIAGYTPKDASKTITIGDIDNEVTLEYIKNPILTVRYLFDGKELTNVPTQIFNNFEQGTPVDIEKVKLAADKIPSGYKYDSVDFSGLGSNDPDHLIFEESIIILNYKSTPSSSSTKTESIPDESVPLASAPAVTSSSTSSTVKATEILDNTVPKSNPPQTGDTGSFALGSMLLAAISLTGIVFCKRRSKTK